MRNLYARGFTFLQDSEVIKVCMFLAFYLNSRTRYSFLLLLLTCCFFPHITHGVLILINLSRYGAVLSLFTPDSIPYGEGNGSPLHYSCLENPVDGGAW